MTIVQENIRRLHHILDAAEHIIEFTKKVSEKDFLDNYEKQSAVVRQIEIIGEAAGKLSSDFIKEHQEIDWKKVVGMRHKMIHDYFEVDADIVWTTATSDIAILQEQVKKILKTF